MPKTVLSGKRKGYAKLIGDAAIVSTLSVIGLAGCGGATNASNIDFMRSGQQRSSSLDHDKRSALKEARKEIESSKAILDKYRGRL